MRGALAPTVREGSKFAVMEPSLTVGLMPRRGNTLLGHYPVAASLFEIFSPSLLFCSS